MTCKDCIHAKVCKDYLAYKLDKALDGIDGSEKPICELFKDRSKFIDLPCKVGDTVWFYSTPLNTTLPVKIVILEMNDVTILYKGIEATYSEFIVFTEKDVNNSIFLTKEQAEKALKEHEKV